jgi:transglutaminase-like putative cysteine protease
VKRLIRGWLGDLSLLTFGLLMAAVYVMAVGLADVAAGVEQSLFIFMAVSGALVGLAIASMRLPGWRAMVLSGLIGLLLILLRVGGIGPQLLQVLQGGTHYLYSVESPWYRTMLGSLDDDRLQQAWPELVAALDVLLARSGAWIQTWVAGEPTFDPVAAALLWSMLLWIAAGWVAWGFRAIHRPLLALIPAAVLLGAALGGVGAKPGPLVWSLGIVISALVVADQDVRDVRWRELGIAGSRRLRRSLIKWAALLAVGLMLAGALSHEITYGKIVRTVEGFATRTSSEGDLTRQAMGLESQVEDEPGARADLDGLRFAGLPRRHLIGSGPELSEQLVLSIRVIEEPEVRGLEAGGPAAPYYWRSNTYDTYIGNGWVTGRTDHSEYVAGEHIRQETPSNSRLVAQRTRSVPELGGLLYSAGALMTVDQPFSVDWRTPDDDFGAVLLEPSISSRVESLVPEISPQLLRESGLQYPDWVTSKYLRLNESVPDRVITLSRELTATARTPYDRAEAIETFLRGFEYSLDIAAPPPNRDIVDYFLFDLQKGYCDYYASSMVVLARAAGLPARMVIGYHTGKYNAELDAYLVSEAEAHSWPEIYFPGYGWVEFEPTAGRPALIRGEGLPYAPALDAEIPAELRETAPSFDLLGMLKSGSNYLLGGLIVAITAGAIWTLVKAIRASRLPPSAVISVIFADLRGQAVALGMSDGVGMTPSELSVSFRDRLAARARRSQGTRLLGPAQQEIEQIVNAYIGASYTRHHFTERERIETRAVWRRLKWRLRWARAIQHFRSSAD